MLGKDFEKFIVEDIYEGISGCEGSLWVAVEEFEATDERLKRNLSFYELLTLLITGKNLVSEVRKVLTAQESKICEVMESIGVSYDDFAVDDNDAVDELMQVTSTKQGFDDLGGAYEEIEEYHLSLRELMNNFSTLQRWLAEVAFEAERLRNGVQAPCLGAFLKRLDEENAEPGDKGIMGWCSKCEKAKR
jgi:hypothetical protein